MPDINLLPDDLKKEEARELGKRSMAEPASVFHLPGSDKKGPENVPAVAQPAAAKKKNGFFDWLLGTKPKQDLTQKFKPARAQVLPAPSAVINDINNKKALPQQPLPKKKEGFFNQLFKKKRRIVRLEKIKSIEADSPALTLPPDGQSRFAHSKLTSRLEKSTQPAVKEIDVNLLPEGIGLISLKRLLAYFALTALSGLICVGFIYFWITIYANGLEARFVQTENEYNLRVGNIKENEKNFQAALAWGDKIESLKQILDKHIYWSKFFPALEKRTIPEVYYNGINITSDGNVTLTGQAPNFLTLARQYLVLLDSHEYFPEVKISGIGGNSQGVSFSVWLRPAPSLYHSEFYSTAENQKTK